MPVGALWQGTRVVALGVALAVALLLGVEAATSNGAPSQVVQSIVLSPQVVTLRNAAKPGHSATSQPNIRVSLRALNAHGQTITGGRFATPIRIRVYGPPGVLTATRTVIASPTASVSFRYSGAWVSSPVVVTAVSGRAFALLSFHPRHRASPGGTSVTFPMADVARNLRSGWHFRLSVGGGRSHGVEMDTGSRGLVVPASALGPDRVGPGPPGHIEYSSDGKIFSGHFYLAPVQISAGGRTVQTVPIELLGVERSSCDLKHYPNCVPGKVSGLGMMGVGFDRGAIKGLPAGGPPELTNAFLALRDVTEGRMDPGYIITPGSVTLGITALDRAGYNMVPLTAGGTGPGDWNTEPGCFSFPSIAGYPARCGTVLVDTGIAGAILGLPRAQRPRSIAGAIPAGESVAVTIDTPKSSGRPPLAYGFRVGDGGPMTPTKIRWAADKAPFVNTGRRPISKNGYLFDAGAGRVGFKAIRS
jgi:hypothetical protein